MLVEVGVAAVLVVMVTASPRCFLGRLRVVLLPASTRPLPAELQEINRLIHLKRNISICNNRLINHCAQSKKFTVFAQNHKLDAFLSY